MAAIVFEKLTVKEEEKVRGGEGFPVGPDCIVTLKPFAACSS